MNKTYTVYRHTSPSKKCYIGITSMPVNKRWKNGASYLRKNKLGFYIHPIFANAIIKYGWDNFEHEVLYTNLTEECAKKYEIELIAYYKKLNKSYNVLQGGDLHKGAIFSEEERRRRSERCKTNNLGRKLSEKTKDKIRKARIGKKIQISEERKKEIGKKISIARTGKPHPHKGNISEKSRKAVIKAHQKPVLQFDLNGNFIKEFKSITEAAKSINGYDYYIINVCKGKYKQRYGYVWKYKINEQEQI